MVFGDNANIKGAGMEFGHNTSGENINFIPNSIVFKPTAKEALDVKMPDGTTHSIKKGEALDDAVVEALNNQDRGGDFESSPWLEGKEKNGLTVSIGFNESVHARFATFVNTQTGSASVRKQNRTTYEKMMSNIGTEALPLQNGSRKP